MSYNKVTLGGTTLIDLTSDTVTDASHIMSGYIGHLADGSIVTGTGSSGSSYLPSSAELVGSSDTVINLSSDTSYDSWTPTTSNTSILSAGSTRAACSYTFSSSTYQDKALIGTCLYYTDIAYVDGTSMAKGYSLNKLIMGIAMYTPMKLPIYSNAYYAIPFYGTIGRSEYYSSSSATAVYASTAYSIGPTGTTFSTSSTTSTSRTVGFTRPAIYARCNSTYFSTTAAGNVDSANSNIYCYHRLWLIDKTDSLVYNMFDNTDGLFFNL